MNINQSKLQPVSNNNVSPKPSPQPNKAQTVVNVQPQKPAVTIATVQPQPSTTQSSISQSISSVTSAILQKTPSVISRQSSTDQSKGKLPQLPPRVQSQNSVTNSSARGPPPAIPPRNNVPAPVRSTSIQVTSSNTMNRPALARQTSANSFPPQCTPQPAPKFVIPQRQNSRTSLTRTGSQTSPNEHRVD